MAQDSHARLVGSLIDLAGTSGPFRTCPNCHYDRGEIGEGSGPHAASLECGRCGRHLSWLSRASLDALAAGLGRAA